MKQRTKSKLVNFRTTPTDYERIRQRAERAELSVSAYITGMALNGKLVVVPHWQEAAKELNRIGVNLNQLTRLSHEGKIQCVGLEETKQEVGRVWQLLSSQTPKAP